MTYIRKPFDMHSIQQPYIWYIRQPYDIYNIHCATTIWHTLYTQYDMLN